MPFRDLILYYLSRSILIEDEYSIKMVISLCRGFQIDIKEIIISTFQDTKYMRYFINFLQDTPLFPEILIQFPENILRELIYLRLYKFSKTLRASYKLNESMKGTAIINNRIVIVRGANDNLINFLFKEYNPQIYTYSNELPISIMGCKIIVCGFSKITFIAYISSRILTNKKLDIIVTEKCIDELVKSYNRHILQNLFNNGNGTINKILKDIFYSFLGGGHTP
nr:transcriptional elongation factor [Wadden Sea poxvirus]